MKLVQFAQMPLGDYVNKFLKRSTMEPKKMSHERRTVGHNNDSRCRTSTVSEGKQRQFSHLNIARIYQGRYLV